MINWYYHVIRKYLNLFSNEIIMKLSDINIIFINMDKNEDRRNHITNELSKIGLKENKIKRMRGINGQTLPKKYHTYFQNKKKFKTLSNNPQRIMGRVGCLLSHLYVLDYAIKHKYENLLVLEDDCYLLVDKDITLPKFPKDADMLYLGGTFWKQKEEPKKQTGNWIHIDREHLKMAGTFGYLIPSLEKIKYIRNKLDDVKPSAIDNLYINHIQTEGRCYTINPVIMTHSNDFNSEVTLYGQKMKSNLHGNSFFYDK